MMKYPKQRGLFTAIVTGFALYSLCPSLSDARIGESRQSLERRLLNSGGIVYRDDTIEANRRKGMPYLRYMEYLPSSADVRVYFKTSDGRRPTSSELEDKSMLAGWDLHVVYVGGQSVIEIYKRSQGISEYELNHLLALHAGGSYWKRPDKEKKAELTSVFGVEMIRDDGVVRAKKLGRDTIMFVDSKIDVGLAEMNTTDLQEKAPVSVDGF